MNARLILVLSLAEVNVPLKQEYPTHPTAYEKNIKLMAGLNIFVTNKDICLQYKPLSTISM